METNGKQKSKRAKARAITTIPRRTSNTELPLVQGIENCDFHGYDADILMKETAKLHVVLPDIGDIIAYKDGLHFCCQEVYPYRNQN